MKQSKILIDERICKLCFKSFNLTFFDHLFDEQIQYCPKCLSLLKPVYKKFKFNDFSCLSLYKYEFNSFNKELLNKIKTDLDVELKDIFLTPCYKYLNFLFRNYVIVYAPSSHEAFLRRGFNQLHEMFSLMNNKKVDVFYKNIDVNQKELNFEERQKIGQYIKTNENIKEIINKKVLIVDDVATTFSTMKACYNILKQYKVKKIKGLTLMYHV